jgi:hypothetical protein
VIITIKAPDTDTVRDRLEQFGNRAARYASQAVSTTTRDTAAAGRKYAREKSGIGFAQKGPSGKSGTGPLRFFWSSSRQQATGSVWAGLNPLSLKYFQPFTPRAMDPEAQQKLSGSYAGKQRFFFSGAFVARMPTGHLGIYKRKGKKRFPIEEQRVSTKAVGLGGISAHMEAFASARLEREMARQMGRLGGDR